MSAPEPHHRRYVVPTRFADNDVYGHVNNVVYYALFDTVINRYLVEDGGLDLLGASVIGVCRESRCTYHRGFRYPEDVVVDLWVGKLGTTSVRYELALRGEGEDAPRAEGYFVHVFVERATHRPVPVPDGLRRALARLVAPG